MHPNEVTTIVMKFDLPTVPFRVPSSPRTGGNEYVWHCHILEHEEHDMMRPLVVQGLNPVASPAKMFAWPAAQTVKRPRSNLDVIFNVENGIAPLTVISSRPITIVTTAAGFKVKVTDDTSKGVVSFTVWDSTLPNKQTATAQLTIV